MKEKINEGVVQYLKEDNAVLLDVRTDEEFFEGRSPAEGLRGFSARRATSR